MRFPTVSFLAFALFLVTTSSVHAESSDESVEAAATSSALETASPDYGRLGPYIAVGGGAAISEIRPGWTGKRAGGSPDFYETAETGSIHLRAGWRFHPYVGAELLWEYQTPWKVDFGDDDADLHVWNLLANLKVNLTTSRWQPFLVTGIGLGRRSLETRAEFFDPNGNTRRTLADDDEGFVARVGGGLEVYLNDLVTIGAEVAWVMGTGSLSPIDYAVTTVVLAYHFE
jgi:opacity protein-like surface antigen